VDTLLAFGSNGRVYSVPVAALPGGRGDGQPVTSMIDLEGGTTLTQYVAGAADIRLLLATSEGFGLVAAVGDMISRVRAGKSFMAMEPSARLLRPGVVRADAASVACLSQSGRLLVFGLDEVKHQPKGGRGITLMEVDGKDPLASVAAYARSLKVSGAGRGGKPRDEEMNRTALGAYAGKRARKGKALDLGFKPQRIEAV
jgi:topoisomerase-4 subunit A